MAHLDQPPHQRHQQHQRQHEHLQQVVHFDRDKLKSTETRVTNYDGRIHIEAAQPNPEPRVETVKLEQHSAPPPQQQQQQRSCPEVCALGETMKILRIKPLRNRSLKRANTDADDASMTTTSTTSSMTSTAPTTASTMTTTTTTTPLKPRSATITQRSWFVSDFEPDLEVAVILPGLTMGSQDAAASLEHLQAVGVTHVINLASFVDNFFKDKLTYKTISARDIPEFKISVHFEEANEFIDEAIKADGVVFVHCNAGISRAGSIVTAYVMKTLRMGFESALAFVKSKRSVVRPNAGFVEQLKEYEKTLKLDS